MNRVRPTAAANAIGRRVFTTAALWLVAGRAWADEPAPLRFDELYKSSGVFGVQFSDKLAALAGRAVRVRGFLAPPLKADSNFLVLAREPVAICPFCQSDADWPNDIVVVYLRETLLRYAPGRPVDIAGKLEIGSLIDSRTGFVSLVRVVDAHLSQA